MGSWNETDSITQLPINYGDKVRVFVLASQTHWKRKDDDNGVGGGTCYSNDLWAPLGLPVQGKYDDYGSIEKIKENQDTEILLERIKANWVPFEEKYDEVSDIKNMPLSEVLHHIERDRAKTMIHGTKQNLGIMFILEDVYQAIINYDEIDAHHQKEYYEYKPVSQIFKEEIKSWYEDALNAYNTCINAPKHDNPLLNELRALTMMDISSSSHFFSGYSETGVNGYKSKLMDLIKKNTPFDSKKVQTLCNSVIEMSRFNRAMTSARKMWHPQSGKGGQNNELAIYKVINAASNKIIEKRDKQGAEDGDSLPDENGYYPYMIEQNLKVKQIKESK